MSDATKKHLRELAEKATPGPWWIDSHGHRMSTEDGMVTVFIADDRMGKATRHPETGNLSHWPNDWDASFIAEANPKTVIGLLDEIEALEAELAKLRAGQEPVAMLCEDVSEFGTVEYFEVLKRIEPGTKLYTTPQPSAVQGVNQQLLEALEALAISAPSACCGDFNHKKGDFHEDNEKCPPLDRYEKACLLARAAIAAARQEGGKV